jgi:hypothetical protein
MNKLGIPSPYTDDNGKVNTIGLFLLSLTAIALVYQIRASKKQYERLLKQDKEIQARLNKLEN